MYLDLTCTGLEYDDDTLKNIEEYANKLMSIRDIAILIGVAPDTLNLAIRAETNDIAIAYNKGKTRRKLDIHEKEIERAETGSAQAMENIHGFLVKMEAEEE